MTHWTDFLDPETPDGRYLRWKEVERTAGISRTTAWRLQKAGDFPKPYVISRGRVGYRESEVEAWKASRGHRQVCAPVGPTNGTARPGLPLIGPSGEPPSWPVPKLAAKRDPDLLPPAPPGPLAAANAPRRSRGRRASEDQITFDF